jgi:transposase
MLIPARTRRAHDRAALTGGVDELGTGVVVGVEDGVSTAAGEAVGVGLVDAARDGGGTVAAVVLQPASTQHTSATVTRFISPRRSGLSIRFGSADCNAVQASIRTTKAGREAPAR